MLLSKDLIKDRSQPQASHGEQLLHNPFLGDLSGVLGRIQLEQRSVVFIVWRLVKLFWPDPVAIELVDGSRPMPRAHELVIRFAGVPLGLKGDLIVGSRCRRVEGRALDP